MNQPLKPLHRGVVVLLHCRISDLASRKRLPDKIHLVLLIRSRPKREDKSVILSEHDVLRILLNAAADSMEIIRDAYGLFLVHLDRKHWRSTAQALTVSSLERVHQMGVSVSSMCILESFHLIDSGQAVRIKRLVKQEGDVMNDE